MVVPLQVVPRKTKEAEITEQDSLLLVSLLPFSASILCDSSGFGRLPPIESLLLARDVLLRFLKAFARGFHRGLVGSNWGRFEDRRARVSSWFGFVGFWWIWFNFTSFMSGL